MMSIVLVITVVSLLVPVYVYAGYPAMLWFFTRGYPARTHRLGDITPTVSLIISCYNEAPVIRAKLDNTLALDYPRNKLLFLVVSDGSDDGTDDVVREQQGQGVRQLRLEGRVGI